MVVGIQGEREKEKNNSKGENVPQSSSSCTAETPPPYLTRLHPTVVVPEPSDSAYPVEGTLNKNTEKSCSPKEEREEFVFRQEEEVKYSSFSEGEEDEDSDDDDELEMDDLATQDRWYSSTGGTELCSYLLCVISEK